MKVVCDAFYEFLKEVHINSHRSTIVKAVAEKVRCPQGVPLSTRLFYCIPIACQSLAALDDDWRSLLFLNCVSLSCYS